MRMTTTAAAAAIKTAPARSAMRTRPTLDMEGADTAMTKSRGRSPRARAPALATLHEIDQQGNALKAVAPAQAVLEVVGVVARQARTGVDLHREAGRALSDLRHVQELETMAAAGWRLAGGDDLGQEPVQLRRRDPPATAVG